MKKDISIHFTTKGQTLSELDEKLQNFISANVENLPFDFSEPTSPRSILHHCFLREEDLKYLGFTPPILEVINDTHDFLGSISDDIVRWKGTSNMEVVWDRRYMLENIAKLKGYSIFLGEVKEGVEDELKIAQELGIDIILIP